MNKLLSFTASIAIIFGIISLSAGIWGIVFTYNNVATENITTPGDASIPNVAVRGPLTLKSQADIIRHHTLESTDGLTYAEMPREIPALDKSGNEIIDPATGEAKMVPNKARDLWVKATTLMTALHLGIVTYVLSGIILLSGLISIWTGITFWAIRKKF